MSLKEIIQQAKGFSTVLVTGPQRSGTTITGKILSKELGYEYIDEFDFDVHNLEKFNHCLHRKNIVVQCPALMHLIHTIYREKDNVFVVVTKRGVKDVMLSEKRIGWNIKDEPIERNKYLNDEVLSSYVPNRNAPVSTIKYTVWENYQSTMIDNNHWVYSHYDYLKGHPWFVTKEKRIHFRPKQTH